LDFDIKRCIHCGGLRLAKGSSISFHFSTLEIERVYIHTVWQWRFFKNNGYRLFLFHLFANFLVTSLPVNALTFSTTIRDGLATNDDDDDKKSKSIVSYCSIPSVLYPLQ
jgi:hypothetical protein